MKQCIQLSDEYCSGESRKEIRQFKNGDMVSRDGKNLAGKLRKCPFSI